MQYHGLMSRNTSASTTKVNGNYPEAVDFLPFVWYDAMFDSFHFEVMGYLLPYYDKMENC